MVMLESATPTPGIATDAQPADRILINDVVKSWLPEDERADYEKWGEVAGHEVMVKVRGAEVSAGSFDFFTAWVPDTGEYAILAGRGAPGAWPYSRPTG